MPEVFRLRQVQNGHRRHKDAYPIGLRPEPARLRQYNQC